MTDSIPHPISRREMLAVTGATGFAALAALAAPQPAAPSPYAARILSLKPAGYWRLGEAKGPTAADASGHKCDGAFQGDLTFARPGALPNDPDHSVALAGKSYVEIPDDEAFAVGAKGLTVEVWLRLPELDFPGQTGASNDPYVHWLGKGVKDHFEWGFRVYSKHRKDGTMSGRPNRVSAYIWNPAGKEGAGAYFEDELKADVWMHVVAVYDPPGPGAGVRIYRDGVCREEPPEKATLYGTYDIKAVHGPAPVRLGTRDLVSFLHGGLDEAAIYPQTLTAAEIKENHRIGAEAKRPQKR